MHTRRTCESGEKRKSGSENTIGHTVAAVVETRAVAIRVAEIKVVVHVIHESVRVKPRVPRQVDASIIRFQLDVRACTTWCRSQRQPLLPHPCAVDVTHPVPPAPPLPGTDQGSSFAQLSSQCVAGTDLLRLCESATALWHRTRCFHDPRWNDFCYGCGEPPIPQSELQAASDIFHFLQLAAHGEDLTSTDHKQAIQSCLHGDQSVTCHLMLWDSRAMNLC